MASIALIIGSTLGACAGLLGWLILGLSLPAALGVYLAVPMVCIAVALLLSPFCSPRPQDAAAPGPIAA
ncbi:hypothetical protein [Marinovum sp.]|uniref:hypothetical protein n=1 Tax=Marinovum sp. TaxID=2024839 RepID=UPI002B26EC73|nr:hypothetical protein [Marinovum sp.]